ncbi:hypothetical protein REPUB_Repub10bG0152500 [Reevesia pubescens]
MTSYDSCNQRENYNSMFRPKTPHFFKIILEDTIRDNKLEIPREFVRKYGDGLSSPVLLKVPSGDTWQVELTKSDGDIWLQNGWQEFAQHYSQKYGHLLVFKYEGNGNFQVLIFDMSATEIEYPYISHIEDHKSDEQCQEPGMEEAKADSSDEILYEPDMEEAEVDNSDEILYEPPPSKKTRKKLRSPCSHPRKKLRITPTDKSTNSAIKIESNVMFETQAPPYRHSGCPARKGDKSTSRPRIERLFADKKAQALQIASSAFKSENPFFLVVMQPSYVGLGNKCRLGRLTDFLDFPLLKPFLSPFELKFVLNFPFEQALPTNFVRKHLMKDQRHVTLCNSNGKTWTVSYVPDKKLSASLRTGWQTFVHDNNIQVGDVCAFELINCVEISFKVVIYQGQSANCHQSFALTDVFRPVKKKARASYARQGCLEPWNAIKKAKTSQIARAFRSENPIFVIVLQPSYVHAHKVSIPEKFARKYFRKMPEEVILHLSNGKSWPVKYYQHRLERPSAKLCCGWRTFVLDNNLQVGDVCVFELTEGTETSLKVTIYKKQVAEDGNSGSPLADKSRENQVELQESLVVKAETDWVNDGDMSSLQHNQHSTEEFPVQMIMENNINASLLLQKTQEEKSVSN